MHKVLTHRFKGIRFSIEIDESYVGLCDNPGKLGPRDFPAISLPNGLPCGNKRGAQNGLVNLIHECLHAEDWSKHEETIDRVASEIGKLLWRLGYRRKKHAD